tara:strand:- start:236 stop:781 length:546 start_codon:yes stop_codon:yes gene_type:complete
MNNIQKKICITPIPVYTGFLDGYKEINPQLIDMMNDHREKYKESNTSNVKSWHSDYRTHKINLSFQPYIDKLVDGCDAIIQKYPREFGNMKNVVYEVFDFWFCMYQTNDYTIKHNHFPCDISCTYYVDVDENASPIMFRNLKIQPKSGMLVMWLGSLEHEVPPTKGNRTVIAMNLMVKSYE